MHQINRPLCCVMIGALPWVAGCGDRTSPVMSDVTFEVNPSGRVPLTARATFTLDEAALATIEIAGPESSWVQTSTSAYQMEHSVMVLASSPIRRTRSFWWRPIGQATKSSRRRTI